MVFLCLLKTATAAEKQTKNDGNSWNRLQKTEIQPGEEQLIKTSYTSGVKVQGSEPPLQLKAEKEKKGRGQNGEFPGRLSFLEQKAKVSDFLYRRTGNYEGRNQKQSTPLQRGE